MSEYLVPAGSGESEYTEKRSSFLGRVERAEGEEQAREFIALIKKQHRDARHNCWCYIIRSGAVRYSDDGEPQGTAGLPMLEVFKHEGIENVVCVVTRYFGGVLLGTGGLARAYTKAATDALENAGIAAMRRSLRLEASCPYSLLERIKTECAAQNGVIADAQYSDKVSLTLLLPDDTADDFIKRISEISAGACVPAVTGEEFAPVQIK